MPAKASSYIKQDKELIWHGFTQMATFEFNNPIMVKSAQGHYLIDVDNKKYFDAVSSLWAITLGHNHPELNQAIIKQLKKVSHSTLLGNSNIAVLELAKELKKLVPVKKPHFLFASDGASAVEQAIKIAYQYWINKGNPKRYFLSLGDAYHGDTIGALSVGDKGFGTDIFNPLCFKTLKTPGYRDKFWVEKAIKKVKKYAHQLVAVIIEPLVQGASGMLMSTPEDLRAFIQLCQSKKVIVIADEIATGFGRTGKMFASNHAKIFPEIITIGKGLTGGYLPMSATVVTEEIYNGFLGQDLGSQTFYHGHTYSGNALCAAVAKKHLEILKRDRIIATAQKRSNYLARRLKDLAGIDEVKEIRQTGLMVGIDLNSSDKLAGRRFCNLAVKKGLFLRPLGNTIVLMPPITISESEIDYLIEILKETLLTKELWQK
jgi:adenosylmethionine-8-amino-7-oxononanoate aminotransferase